MWLCFGYKVLPQTTMNGIILKYHVTIWNSNRLNLKDLTCFANHELTKWNGELACQLVNPEFDSGFGVCVLCCDFWPGSDYFHSQKLLKFNRKSSLELSSGIKLKKNYSLDLDHLLNGSPCVLSVALIIYSNYMVKKCWLT